MNPTPRRRLGDRGELVALQYLQEKGYEFRDQNVTARGGELDLVMWDRVAEEWVFVEVKTRRHDQFGSGMEAITPEKLKRMMAAIESYFLKKLQLPEIPDFRIEAVIITLDAKGVDIEHIEDIGYE